MAATESLPEAPRCDRCGSSRSVLLRFEARPSSLCIRFCRECLNEVVADAVGATDEQSRSS